MTFWEMLRRRFAQQDQQLPPQAQAAAIDAFRADPRTPAGWQTTPHVMPVPGHWPGQQGNPPTVEELVDPRTGKPGVAAPAALRAASDDPEAAERARQKAYLADPRDRATKELAALRELSEDDRVIVAAARALVGGRR
jgi:hypothetical protein